MFKMINSLTKATVGLVVEAPVSVVADVVTLGGSMTDRHEPYTSECLKRVVKNIKNSTQPD